MSEQIARPPDAAGSDPAYETLKQTEEFAELRRRYASFVLPATIAFLVWYLLYVLMSNWAHDFMSERLAGHINVALIFGLLQFLTTFLIAWLYARHMNRSVDPIARDLEQRFQQTRRAR